jgi:hypothetical protein
MREEAEQKDPTHPRPFMNIEEFWTELYALSFML